MKYFDRNNIDKEKIASILEEYRSAHGEYPNSIALSALKKENFKVIPSIRFIQNNGGIIRFYREIIGIEYTDARTGFKRADTANRANRRSQSTDVLFSRRLVEKFGESNVHWQSPYNTQGESLHRSDFKVFKPDGSFFFVDLFFPQDGHSLQGCLNTKMRKLSKIKIEKNSPVFFISCNEEGVLESQIADFIKNRKTPIPSNIHILHINQVDTVLLS